mgnify:CR=1 FL=1
MERRKEESIEKVLLRFLRQSQLETPLNEHRLIAALGEVAGVAAERLTESLRVYNQTLYVKLRSAMLRNELSMKRSDLVKKLNAKVGVNVIVDIAFS